METDASEAAPVPVEKQVGETTVTFDITALIPSSPTVRFRQLKFSAQQLRLNINMLLSLNCQLRHILQAILPTGQSRTLSVAKQLSILKIHLSGNHILNVNQLKDTLTVSLGTDNSILVKREKRQDFTSKKVLGSNKTETYSFLINCKE